MHFSADVLIIIYIFQWENDRNGSRSAAYCLYYFLPLGGAAALQSLVDGFSIEMATLLFVATISVYTLMGGLGAAFYVSYFNTGSIMILIVVFLVKVFFDESDKNDNNLLGNNYFSIGESSYACPLHYVKGSCQLSALDSLIRDATVYINSLTHFFTYLFAH